MTGWAWLWKGSFSASGIDLTFHKTKKTLMEDFYRMEKDNSLGIEGYKDDVVLRIQGKKVTFYKVKPRFVILNKTFKPTIKFYLEKEGAK